MINVVIFTPETRSTENIYTSKGYSVAQDPDYYKKYFSGLVEMTLDDATWKRVLSMDNDSLPVFIERLIAEHADHAHALLEGNKEKILIAA